MSRFQFVPAAVIPTLPPAGEIGFGRQIAPYQFAMDFRGGGWERPRIEPYDPSNILATSDRPDLAVLRAQGVQLLRHCLPGQRDRPDQQIVDQFGEELIALVAQLRSRVLPDAALCFQYGQGVIEGFKAYRSPHDQMVRLFRPRDNFARFQIGCARQQMPAPELDLWLEAIEAVIRANRAAGWLPDDGENTLYVRPLIRPSNQGMRLQPGREFDFRIICSPAGPYFDPNQEAIRVKVEYEIQRVAAGGLGDVKAVSNYANQGPALEAKQQGYDQVLWLDCHGSVQELSSANIFFVVWDGERTVVRTPRLNGNILPGITRESVLCLLRTATYPVTEQYAISVRSLTDWADDGKLLEAFATGTAAVISPIAEIRVGGDTIPIATESPVGHWLRAELRAIQYGQRPDPEGWIHFIAI